MYKFEEMNLCVRSYDVVYDLYIVNNLSIRKCGELTELGSRVFYKLINTYGIKKNRDSMSKCSSASVRDALSKKKLTQTLCNTQTDCCDSTNISSTKTSLSKSSVLSLDNDKLMELVVDLYITKNNTQRQCASELCISIDKFKKLLKHFNIVKSKELLSECKSKIATGQKQDTVGDVHLDRSIAERYSKEFVYDLYITQNLSGSECRKHMGNMCKETFAKVLSYYGIEKDNHLRYESARNKRESEALSTLISLCDKIGYDSVYKEYIVNNHTMKECCDIFCIPMSYMKKMLERFNIHKDEASILQTRLNNKRKNCLDKYGVDSTAKLDWVKDKRVSTCIDRYGVPYTCMTDFCRGAGTSNDSAPNRRFESFLEMAGLVSGVDFIREKSIKNHTYVYDFLVNNDTLVEIDPSYSHNSTCGYRNYRCPLDKMYHHNKTSEANESGYRCIHVFDWDDQLKIAMSLTTKETLYARKCSVEEISPKDANKFTNTYHLQGVARGNTVNVCLKHNDMIVSVMSFGKPRYNKKYQYELLRYCSSCNIVGGADKLFKYFVYKYEPQSIISYCDLSKFTGKVYEKLGFDCIGTTIGKHWYNYRLGKHITDNLLRQRGFDQLLGDVFGKFGKGTSNEELMLSHGFVEIYDAGQKTFVWRNNMFNNKNNLSVSSKSVENAEVITTSDDVTI